MNYKIVIIGAGSTNFGLGIVSDFFKSKILKGATIVLHDINSETLKNTLQIALSYKEKLGVDYKIEATTSRTEALKDANFCLISIEVGRRFDLWDQDWKIPLQYGIKQVYGENGGPGGLFHAMRQIPAIIKICEDIEKICPDAYIFSYSNPMQRICHALTTRFPDLKIVGLCHEIASMERQLPSLLETTIDNIDYEAGGLNHLSILLNAKFKDSGEDGYPLIKEKFDGYYSSLVNDHEGFYSKAGAERGVFFEIYKQYGYLPITTDSHLGEYLSWAYSVADHDGILDFYENYKKRCLNYYSNDSYDQFFDEIKTEPHERIIPIIENIVTDTNAIEHAVNIPNQGFIECLPKDIVVEVPSIVNKNGIKGKKLENYPKSFGALLNSQVGTIQMTTEAVLKESKQDAYFALLSDPVVDNAKAAASLLDTMLEFQKEYLGYLK
ncbi:glycosyl hydrolase family 4 [Alphaproteobacteria bacterium]|nr:glycosyl hydrolase family 4 [Alphaproteobacteria bacterium]MDB2635656.1 glycosyl hydrolase family 4 [Alphaproteobacteria bacterium]